MPSKRRHIVWMVEWPNPDPDYWFKKQDSFQEAIEQIAAAEDLEAYVITLHATRSDEAIHRGVHYLFCRNAAAMLERLRSVRPDVLHFWGLGRSTTQPAAKEFPHLPTTVYPVGQQLSTDDMPWANRFFVSTEEDRERLIGMGSLYPRNQIVVCPFSPVASITPKDHGDANDRYDVLYVSDWRKVKRQHLLLEALPEIDFTRVAFIGSREDSSYFTKCEPLARKTYSRGYIELIDRIPAWAVLEHYAMARVVVQLSESEGGSRVVQECLASGVPLIVCSDCRVNASQVRHGETGFVVDPTPSAIAEQVNALLREVELRRVVGGKAAEAAREHRETHSMPTIFYRVTRQLLQEHSA